MNQSTSHTSGDSLEYQVPPASAAERLGLELAREMRRCWKAAGNGDAGERPAAETLLSRHPELCQHPEAAVEVIYEEYCLRQAAGDEDAEQDILRRFPQWAAPLRVMLDCHRCVLESRRDRPRYPGVGEAFGDFRLLAELVRGSRGRVFLATQTTLADRPVVLKITPLDGGEHLSLARLQHTNIVPIHSVVDDATRCVRALCMPYFGRATLASLLVAVSDVPPEKRTGRHVVEVIDAAAEPTLTAATAGGGAAGGGAAGGAARKMLESVSYVQAICWIAACVADALHFAHERGVVHLDLKPSNVLLASDGQPMLLDFHLARAPIRPHGPLAENFGGTPPYMPPEQQAAMRSLRNGVPVNVAVDGRADIYALGSMLYQSLGGQLPVTPDRPPLVRANPHVSVGLCDIVARCLAPRPQDRYVSAEALADDLRRHLTDQPLAGVRNRSLSERWHKWRRRRPGALRAVAVSVLLVTAGAVLLAGAGWNLRDRVRQAALALADGDAQLRAGHVAEAVKSFERGLARVENLPFERPLRRQLRDQLTSARRRQLALQLHRLADEVRVLYGTESISAAQIRALTSQCDALWQKRGVILELAAADGDPAVAADFQDIALCAAHLKARLPDPQPAARRRDALRLLDEVEAAFGPSAVLLHERRILMPPRDPGSSIGATSAPTVRTAREHYVLGRAFLASGDLPSAARELARAVELQPAGRWPNFYYGLCAYRMGRYHDAVTAFSVCIGASPDLAGCFYNRALAHTALGRVDQALQDYNRALQIDPTHAPSALNRGMLHYQHARHELALADLRLALRHGADAATVHYDLALVHLAVNDQAAARRSLRRALETDPADDKSRQLLDALERARPTTTPARAAATTGAS